MDWGDALLCFIALALALAVYAVSRSVGQLTDEVRRIRELLGQKRPT